MSGTSRRDFMKKTGDAIAGEYLCSDKPPLIGPAGS